MTTRFVASYPTQNLCPTANLREYAFIGRSNVGKSSLINMLAGVEGIAKVSQTPGKTQTINYFMIDETWYLVDLPGYGYARTSKSNRKAWGKMIEDYFIKQLSMQCAFLLIDACVSPQQPDLEFIQFLGGEGIPFVIVFTKTDRKKKGVDIEENIERFKAKLSETWEQLPTMFVTSAEKKVGKTEILNFIQSINNRK